MPALVGGHPQFPQHASHLLFQSRFQHSGPGLSSASQPRVQGFTPCDSKDVRHSLFPSRPYGGVQIHDTRRSFLDVPSPESLGSSSGSFSSGFTPGATLASFVGLNQRLSSSDSRSRFFPGLPGLPLAGPQANVDNAIPPQIPPTRFVPPIVAPSSRDLRLGSENIARIWAKESDVPVSGAALMQIHTQRAIPSLCRLGLQRYDKAFAAHLPGDIEDTLPTVFPNISQQRVDVPQPARAPLGNGSSLFFPGHSQAVWGHPKPEDGCGQPLWPQPEEIASSLARLRGPIRNVATPALAPSEGHRTGKLPGIQALLQAIHRNGTEPTHPPGFARVQALPWYEDRYPAPPTYPHGLGIVPDTAHQGDPRGLVLHQDAAQLTPLSGLELRPVSVSQDFWDIDGGSSDLPPPRPYDASRPWHCVDEDAAAFAERGTISHRGVSFKVTHILGEGGAGRVVRAVHNGKGYAVKVIHEGLAASRNFTREMFIREMQIMSAVSESDDVSKYLATLKMSWEDADRGIIYLVMDMFPTDLFSVLRGAPITQNDRHLYCKELVSALCALRDLGYVHLDIKPSNILIDARGRAVLADFGMARVAPTELYEELTLKTRAGTYAYMAPEMVSPNMPADGYKTSVDVWSMGLVFMEILRVYEGMYFQGQTLKEIQQEHCEKLPITASFFHLGQSYAILLSWMTEIDPAKRISVHGLLEAYVLSRDWDDVRKGTATHDWSPSMGYFKNSSQRDCADFIEFGGRMCSMPTRLVDSAEFEYCAPGIF